MQERANGSAALAATIGAVAVVLAAANFGTLAYVWGTTGVPHDTDLAALASAHLPALIYFIAAPLLAGGVIALLAARRWRRVRSGPSSASASARPSPRRPPPASPCASSACCSRRDG